MNTVSELIDEQIIPNAPFVVRHFDFIDEKNIDLYNSDQPVSEVEDEDWFDDACIQEIYPEVGQDGEIRIVLELDSGYF